MAATLKADEFDDDPDRGYRNLFRALFVQSLRDIVKNIKDKNAPAEIALSARWLEQPAGRVCIQALMPSVSADRILRKINENPQAILWALENSSAINETTPSISSSVSIFSFTQDGVTLIEGYEAKQLSDEGNMNMNEQSYRDNETLGSDDIDYGDMPCECP